MSQFLYLHRRYHETQKALEAAEARFFKDPTPANSEAFERAQDAFAQEGGVDVQLKVNSILSGLGFTEEDHQRGCNTFSGGWQMRIALARLLLSEPTVLLLDEPTNHLDSPAKAWLTNFLSVYPGTVLLVSHEEALLSQMACTTIAEVRNGKVELFR